MRTEHNKLVRDRIPEILERAGLTYTLAMLNEQEYQQALRAKLCEEAAEAASADGEHLISELADLYEVIDTLMANNAIDPATVHTEQERRRSERGGFAQRIRLLDTVSES
ncbi:MAG: nucleoside triphosphate pyrophosphohydrolase [Ktedonobacteraceae bacterium]|nr:nucleoside triphosphate pyrophosphohydrolase [Ktedonobacteraceae bacterium]